MQGIVAVSVSWGMMASFSVSLSALALQDQETVYEPGDGVTAPVLVHSVQPAFPVRVVASEISGAVLLEGIVRANGELTDVRVVRSLHPEIDRAALDAFAKCEFKPGRKDGQPVAVRITMGSSLTFSTGPDPVYEPGGKITAPTLVTQVKPVYPDADREAGRTGIVGLECVVRRNGIPSDIVVTKRVYPSLDEAAVAALKQWRFKPGARGLTDVSVRIQLTITVDSN